MKDIIVRPIEQKDVEKLEGWCTAFQDAALELPFGWMKKGSVHTEVVENRDVQPDELMGSLTLRLVGAIDPFVKNPAASPTQVAQTLVALQHVLCSRAIEAGCVEVFIQVPKELEQYQEFLTNHGYEKIDPECVILKRRLTSK